MEKFNKKGLVCLVFYAISSFCFLLSIGSLFYGASGSRRALEEYLVLMILAILANPKTWEFIKRNLFK